MKRSVFLITTLIVSMTVILINAPMVFSKQTTGVIVVDVQGDFTTLKKGSLAVNGTDKAFIDKVKKATEALKKKGKE